MTPRPTGHHGEKPSETLVRFTVEHALRVRVCCYDDRRGDSRVDAIIHRRGGVPLEIVSDPLVDGNKLKNALDKIGRRANIDGLKHGYKVCLTNRARANDLGWVESTLRLLEDPETSDRVARRSDIYDSIVRWPPLSAGEVLFVTGGGGGLPDPDLLGVVTAASAILARHAYADVARKLGAYGGIERHAVVVVDEEKTSIFSSLRKAQPADLDELPTPELAEEITHFWITPRYPRGLTMLWSASTGWQGMTWRWGDPSQALSEWGDPVCPVNHLPTSATSGP